MRLTRSIVLGVALAGLVAGSTWGYALHQRAKFRNFHVVTEGVLYRSGQMPLAGLQSVVHDYNIKTVISLREAHKANEPPPDLAEQQFCESEEITHIRISPQVWWARDGSVPAEAGVRKFLDIMSDSENYPVLLHCFAGCHRTGAHCAIYRMEREHWDNARAIEEMKQYGYTNIEEEFDILGYLEQYVPRWKRPEAGEPVSPSTRSFSRPGAPAQRAKPERGEKARTARQF